MKITNKKTGIKYIFDKSEIAYHCTENEEQIFKDGYIKPMRLKSVYLFSKEKDAIRYCQNFHKKDYLTVVIFKNQILRKWKASYGNIIRLKVGETVKVK